ncbi:hypothetical protein L207DRAFT_589244 [Hyaloscypha variabilis F]|uniref:CFEM domain-containing protein n=1 Tax=Hyaloscypha variabilis (strain UAMH 11265 / GT02V1 / F) TaxID=1149755 RepID=A0A2J6R5B4_HYAVF|nr:hypothetical protein L207DRAFT_589244 [Hyaloscypha variabilis F]
MYTRNIIVPVALLISQALAATNLTQLLADIPPCTLQCATTLLLPAGCEFTNLTACLCTSVDLQRNLSLCVLDACTVSEQAVTLTSLQNDVCMGVPYPSRSREIIRDIIIMAAVTFPVIALRFVSRRIVTNMMGWDDWAIGVSALIMIPMTAIPIINATRGFGNHFWDVPVTNLEGLRKLYYISQIMYSLILAAAKMSILFLYLRIFLNKTFRLATYITMACVLGQTIAFALVIAFQCTPVDSYWDTTIPGKCIHSQAFVYSAAGINILEDLIIMFLPVMELRALKLDLRKKFALGFMFALGSFACITSMIRLKYIISYGTSIDLTYDNVDVIIWSVLETFTAIICASLMCFRPLLVRLLPAIFQSNKTTTASMNTPNPPQSWGQLVSSRLGSKLRSGNHGIELSSVDEETRGGKPKEIRVQTTWVTETTTGGSPERGLHEKYGGWSESHANRSDDSL